MNLLGTSAKKRVLRDIDNESVSTKRLKVGAEPDSYEFPESGGNQGDVLVLQQPSGELIFEAQGGVDPAQIDHDLLLNSGVLTHATIDSYLDQPVKISSDVSFNSLTAVDVDVRGIASLEQDSMSRNQTTSGFPDGTEGFQFSITEPTEFTAVGLQVEHLGAAGVRTFRIWRVADQTVVLTTDIGSVYPIVNGRYKHTLDPSIVLPLGTYRVGIDNLAKRNSTNQTGFLNPNLLPVFGVYRSGSVGYPDVLSSQNIPLSGYLYFRQPPETQGTLTAQNVVIGSAGDVYTLPPQSGYPGQLLKLEPDGQTLGWGSVGLYSQYQPVTCAGWATGDPDPGPTSLTLLGTATSKGSLFLPANILKEGDSLHAKISGSIISEAKNQELTLRVVGYGFDYLTNNPVTWYFHEADFIEVNEVKTQNAFDFVIDMQVRQLGIFGTSAGIVYSSSQLSYNQTNMAVPGAIWTSNHLESDMNLSGTNSQITLDITAAWSEGAATNLLTVESIVITKTF